MSYFQRVRARRPEPRHVGGHAVDDWARLHRMLVQGGVQGSYIGPEHALARDHVRSLRASSEPWQR